MRNHRTRIKSVCYAEMGDGGIISEYVNDAPDLVPPLPTRNEEANGLRELLLLCDVDVPVEHIKKWDAVTRENVALWANARIAMVDDLSPRKPKAIRDYKPPAAVAP